MSNIGTYNRSNSAPISYAKVGNYTTQIQRLVQYLHDSLPIIQQEFDDLEEKAKIKPCIPFDDKMEGLSNIYKATEKLYYWYIENAKRQA